MNHHLTAPAATLVGVLPFVLTGAGAAPAGPPTPVSRGAPAAPRGYSGRLRPAEPPSPPTAGEQGRTCDSPMSHCADQRFEAVTQHPSNPQPSTSTALHQPPPTAGAPWCCPEETTVPTFEPLPRVTADVQNLTPALRRSFHRVVLDTSSLPAAQGVYKLTPAPGGRAMWSYGRELPHLWQPGQSSRSSRRPFGPANWPTRRRYELIDVDCRR